MKQHESCVFVGTKDGSLYQITQKNTPQRFDELYRIVETNSYSLETFSQLLGRSISYDQAILDIPPIFDLDFLNEFKHKEAHEKEKILEASDFTIEEAHALIEQL